MSQFRIITILLSSLFFVLNINAATITIGTGTATNSANSYPAPYGNFFWGARHQFLITAAELNAAGMTAGNINSLSFDVDQAEGTPLQGFTVSLGNTTTTTLSTWLSGLTQVLTPTTYTETSGLNTHTFSSPFFWDGISNLVVETCFNNTSFTTNATTRFTATTFNSSLFLRLDQAGVCTNTSTTGTSINRPNMIFDWNVLAIPTSTNFSSNTTFTCSGTVSFTDASTETPTSWAWDFGDSNTDTVQNPIHTYTTNGMYDVQLITCNSFGCDTLLIPNFITVNSAASVPTLACIPNTLNYCCGFGITNVSFNTINNSSGDGTDGYSDFTCTQTMVLEGQNYTLSIQTSAASTQNYAAWIDFNNDGILNDVTERVFTASSQLNTSGTINIPVGTTLNTPLRLRIAADFDFSAAPTPCMDIDRGQVEDYSIIVNANLNPPSSAFSADPTTTCDGNVCFTDESLNAPTGWLWDFGDGNSSFSQNPCHTYSSDGTYTVTLTTTNVNGFDIDSIVNYVTANTAGQVASASCSPSTTAYCCAYGIYQVDFNTISNASLDGIEGYQDFSCSNSTSVTEGLSYLLTVTTGINNAQDTRAWIDFNNDGIFNNTNELVMDIGNAFNPSQTIQIPGGTTINTSLRMRISSDVVGAAQSACDNNNFGQTEDYGITIMPNILPPVANFTASTTNTCSDIIQFTDLSTNVPTNWLWNFGDGTTSTLQNPSHSYMNSGTYNVTLTATNAFGSNTINFNNYININCSNINVPTTGTINVTACSGTLFDDGGQFANHSDNTDGAVVIQPTGAVSVTLNFISFDFVNSFSGDTLFIYDGPSTASPLIGFFIGNTSPGTISSSGGSITIRQKTDGAVTDPGFELNWACTVGAPPISNFSASITNTCTNPIQFNDLSTSLPSSWLWYFGDGTTSSLQNPAHTYSNTGLYTVSLVTTNSFGTDSIAISNYININCPGVSIPNTGTTITTACNGTLYDDGGGLGNYSNNTDGSITIQPVGAAQISINFTSFNFESINLEDTLFVYDGPSTTSPLITFLVGNSGPSSLFSSGGSITIRQKTNGTINDVGFELNWACNLGSPPSSNFSASTTNTCTDAILFTDLSTNIPTSWLWYFGDGTTSPLQNPTHTYTNTGTYTVSLVTTNSFGQDSTAINNYITINCPAENIPTTGSTTSTACNGTLTDDGGPTSDYSSNSDGTFTIQPLGATQVSLDFISFSFFNGIPGDSLLIYDGPSTSSPLLATLVGNTNPGIITSTGGSITIRQKTDFIIEDAGFELNWACLTTGIEDIVNLNDLFNVYPNPASNVINIEKSDFTSLQIKELHLFNSLGQMVMQKNTSTTNPLLQMDIAHLPKGFYFLNITSNEGLTTKKINIQ